MKKYLVTTILAILISIILIVFDVRGIFPLGMIWSDALIVLIFALTLWRPRQVFWIFISILALESVIFLSIGNFVSLRPFQVLGGLLILAVLIRMALKKNDFVPIRFRGMFRGTRKIFASKKKKDELDKFFEKEEGKEEKFPHFNILDLLVFLLPVFAFLSVVNSSGEMFAVKQALILTSFVFLYWLAKNYLQTKKDKFEAIWFFVIGSLPVIFYGIFQAIAFQNGWVDLEIFDERINSVFTEPDWLGMYLIFLVAIVFWLKFLLWHSKGDVMIGKWSIQRFGNRLLDVYLLFIFIALVLTVARSAWLGLVGVVIVYFSLLFLLSWQRKGKLNWKVFLKKPFNVIYSEIFYFVILVVMGMGLIYILNLSSFHLGDRAGSSFSGMQKITVSCEAESGLLEKIQNIEELENFDCRHINIDEIDQEREMGFEIKEVYRPDPNIEIRKDVYSKTWSSIKSHWVLGQGIGSSAMILGLDENGTGLNASNIFLEIWVSIGIFGLVTLASALFVPAIVVTWKLFGSLFSPEKKMNWFNVSFIALVFVALVIPNLFNAGWLLGFFWVALAIYVNSYSE